MQLLLWLSFHQLYELFSAIRKTHRNKYYYPFIEIQKKVGDGVGENNEALVRHARAILSGRCLIISKLLKFA